VRKETSDKGTTDLWQGSQLRGSAKAGNRHGLKKKLAKMREKKAVRECKEIEKGVHQRLTFRSGPRREDDTCAGVEKGRRDIDLANAEENEERHQSFAGEDREGVRHG